MVENINILSRLMCLNEKFFHDFVAERYVENFIQLLDKYFLTFVS